MLQQVRAEDYVIATGETKSLTYFVEAVFAYLSLDWKDHVKSVKSMRRQNDILISRANPFKAKSRLSWQARHLTANVASMMVEARLGDDNPTAKKRTP